MPLSRSETLLAITNLLEEKISQAKIYEWALAQAVAKDYDVVVKDDPLLGETIQVLIDMNHQQGYVPTREDLQYYKDCLEGNADFEPLAVRLEKTKRAKQAEAEKKRAQPQPTAGARPKTIPRKIMRVYVVLFALTSLIVNITGIIKPGYYRPEDIVTRADAIKEAIPHFIYIAFLLMPPHRLAAGFLSYLALPVLFFGTIFYFYITVSIVFQQNLNPLLLLVYAPFALIPALLALWLLITEKKH